MAGLGSGAVRRRSRAPGASSPAGALAVAGLAAAAGVAGFILFLSLLAPPRPGAPGQPGRVVAGNLVLELQNAGWITHDDIGGPTPADATDGFQMPASMMPGMPDHGVHRLYLEAVISDVGSSDAAYTPREFSVRAPDGATWALSSPSTFVAGSLQPGQTRSLDLLFDVPEAVTALQLQWTHDGQVQLVPVG